MTKRVLIVGAGPGGLATAMLLAKAGLDVKLIERQPVVGGRTSTLTAEGFRFDVGPTFFLYPQILADIYAATGYDLHREVDLIRLDPQYRLVFGSGGELSATPDLARMEQEVARFSPRDAQAVTRFLSDNAHKFERFKPCLESPFLSWRSLLSPQLLKLLPLLRPWRSLDRELATYFADPRIRLAFSFQSKYLGMSPFNCPSLFSILSFLEYEYGVFHPRGGCGAVTASMAQVATEIGVDIALNEPAESLLFDGNRAIGVRTAVRDYRADAVVLNADFAEAMTTLVPDPLRRRWTNRRIERKRFSCSTVMLYLGIEGSYPNIPHHTIYLAKDYIRNLHDIETAHVLHDDPSFYVENPSVTDSSLAPDGMSALYVLVPVTHQHPNVDWQQEAPRYRSLALRQLAKVGITDIEPRIRFERMLTPDSWERDHGIYRGATFSLSHNLRQMLHWRPHNRFEDLQSVYLVGGGTHPGSGLPVIFESSRITSRLLLEDFDLPTDWLSPGSPRHQTPAEVFEDVPV